MAIDCRFIFIGLLLSCGSLSAQADFNTECAPAGFNANAAPAWSETHFVLERDAGTPVFPLGMTVRRLQCPLDANRGFLTVSMSPSISLDANGVPVIYPDVKFPKVSVVQGGTTLGWFGSDARRGGATPALGQGFGWAPGPADLTRPELHALRPDAGIAFNALAPFQFKIEYTYEWPTGTPPIELNVPAAAGPAWGDSFHRGGVDEFYGACTGGSEAASAAYLLPNSYSLFPSAGEIPVHLNISRYRCPLDSARSFVEVTMGDFSALADARQPKVTVIQNGVELGWFGGDYVRGQGTESVYFGQGFLWQHPRHAGNGRLDRESLALKPAPGSRFDPLAAFRLRIEYTASWPTPLAPIEWDVPQAQERGPLQFSVDGLWWTRAEPGWGLMVQRNQAGTVYANWHTFDENGKPVWFVMPNGQPTAERNTIEGEVYFPSGPPLSSAPFDASFFKPNFPVGRFRLRFAGDDAGTFEYQINGRSGTKSLERLVIRDQAGKVCSSARGVWWNRDEPGWAIAIEGGFDTHGCPMHTVWSTYDQSGRPTWYLAGTSAVRTVPFGLGGTFTWYEGGAYQPRGPYFGAPFDPAQFVPGNPAGVLEHSGSNGPSSFRYELGTIGRTVHRMERFLF